MKNNRLTTYSKADVNYLNSRNNLFWDGSSLSIGTPRIAAPSTPLINITSDYSTLPSLSSKSTTPSTSPVSLPLSRNNITWGDIKGIGKGIGSIGKGIGNVLKGIGGGSIVGGIGTAIGFGLDIANSFAAVDRHLKEETLKVNLIANLNVDTSSNRSIVSSIGNQYTLRDRTKSDMLDSASSIGGLFGNWLAGGKAKRAAAEVNMAKQLALNRLDKSNDLVINQANESNSLLSQSNITAFGGPIDTIDITNPLGYDITLNWLDILQSKANKDKLSLTPTTNTLGNDTLFKLFSNGGNLNEGDEIDLTEELIKELERLGYKLEY